MTQQLATRLSVLMTSVFLLSLPCVLAQQERTGLERSDRVLYLYVMQAAAMPNVQKELKLTDDQLATMAEIRQSMSNAGNDPSETRRALAEAAKTIEKTLSIDQVSRLKQIHLQALRIDALLLPNVVEVLAISAEQQRKLQEIETKRSEKARQFTKNIDMPLSERQTKGRQLQKEFMEEALGVLTPLQRERFEKMKGADFDFSQRVAPPKGYAGRKSAPPEEK